jgi:hypothetical protein
VFVRNPKIALAKGLTNDWRKAVELLVKLFGGEKRVLMEANLNLQGRGNAF